jgi:hypothetical protein
MNGPDLVAAEKFAKLLFNDEQIAVLLEMSIQEFRVEMSSGESPLKLAVLRGRLTTEAEVRAAIINAAKRGSSPAQAMAVQYLNRIQS